MKKYITTPIYYVNNIAHIGHAYTTIIADTMAKFYKISGVDTYFATGTDEHGQKIEQAAKIVGKTPKEYADEISAKFRSLWDKFDIEYDYFVRTTDENHKISAQKAFEKMYKKGDIYKGEYEGFYCVSCETFFTKLQLLDNDRCPDCGKKTNLIKEESYFFKLSKYQDALLDWYEKNDDCIVPKNRKNEIVNFVKGGLRDLSITRTSFEWGIKLPQSIDDPKHIMYVWLDALINYLSVLGYENGNDKMSYWDDVLHIVGKDILRFHAIYWPAFLLSLDIALPKHIAAHGWWTKDGEKMSKGKGNVINPEEIADAYGLESFRYFVLREIPFGQDGDFSEKALIDRINSELSNGLGNLLSRSVGMSSKYSNFVIDSKNVLKFYSQELDEATAHINEAIKNIQNLATNRYLEEIWKVVALANGVIAKYEPWNLIKNNKADEANALVALCINLLAKISLILYPAMPKTSIKIADTLGFEITPTKFNELIKQNKIENFKLKACEPLFVRIEKELLAQDKDNKTDKEQEQQNDQAIINIDDFAKIVIKVGEVLDCQRVQGSEKLLKFKIDLGENQPRTILSGIAKFYNPSELIGKQVCVLANLKGRKIMKEVSEGMILSANDGKLVLISPEQKVKNGSIIG